MGWAWIFSETTFCKNGMVCGALVQELTNGHRWQVRDCSFLHCTEMLHLQIEKHYLAVHIVT